VPADPEIRQRGLTWGVSSLSFAAGGVSNAWNHPDRRLRSPPDEPVSAARPEKEMHVPRIIALAAHYTLPTPGAVLNFLDAGTTVPSGPGQLMLSGQNVVQPGDSLTIYIDAATKKTQRYDVRVQNFNYQQNGM
jgi:hypothetical protein